MKRRLKINGVIIFLAVMLLILFPRVFLRSAKDGPSDKVAEIAGIILILLGQILRTSGRGYKSENSGKGQSLIRGGPYALVRNPMYLGIIFIGLGIVLMLFNWWAVVIFICIFIWRYTLLMFKEEKKLLAMFPGEYEEYRKKVPRLLPSLNALLQKDITECLPLRVSWIKKEIGTILAVLLPVLFLDAWIDLKNEGINTYLKEAKVFFAIMILFAFLIIYLIRSTNNPQKDASNKSQNTL